MTTMGTNQGDVSPPQISPQQTGRVARNLAEKNRRDKLNSSIQELATIVPHVAESTRRMDKTAVLRFATHGLRLQYVFGKSAKRKRRTGRGIDSMDTLMQLLDSFFITLTCHGQIVLVSTSVEQLLGHCQSDLYGQNILNITHPDDQALLQQQLIPHDMERLFRDSDDHENEAHNSSDADDFYRTPLSSPRLVEIDQKLLDDVRSFKVRLARAGTRSESTSRSYEIVKIDGCFRRSDFSATAGNFPIVAQLIRRSRSTSIGVNGSPTGSGTAHLLQHDAIAQAAMHGISGNDIVLVARVRIIRPPKIQNPLLDANKLEYRTRHLIDGRIVDCDQRIGLVAGYMKDEVRNLSPFSFMHQDDVRWVIVALRQMYDCYNDYGESCYRLLTRNGTFIYLQTKGYLEIDKSTNQVHSFLCVNTLLDEEEGRRRVQEMKNKFSIIIQKDIPCNSVQDMPASQNPQHLERIVLYLIENLQKRNEPANSATSASEGSSTSTGGASPALVPPEPASVRNSISKSVNVVNVTAAKNLFYSLKFSPASYRESEASLSPASSFDQSESEHFENSTYTTATNNIDSNDPASINNYHRPSVLQMNKESLENSPSISLHAIAPMISTISTGILSPTTPPATHALQQKISVLKRLHTTPPYEVQPSQIAEKCRSMIKPLPVTYSSTPSSPTITSCAAEISKQNTSPTTPASEIHSVLCTSLQNIEQSLFTMSHETRSLYEQRSRLPSPVPRFIDQKLDAIIEEHQKHKKILVNIKSEYDELHNVQQYQQNIHHQQVYGRPDTPTATATSNANTLTDSTTLLFLQNNKPSSL